MQLNASRIKVLQAQDDLVNSMKEAAAKELLNVSHDHHVYKHLLKELIVQVSTTETDQSVICILLKKLDTTKLMDHYSKDCLIISYTTHWDVMSCLRMP